jgi:hypothetical protein
VLFTMLSSSTTCIQTFPDTGKILRAPYNDRHNAGQIDMC